MIKIPFTKAHGAKNDFLLTWAADAPPLGLGELARSMCDRHTGVGADGWILMTRSSDSSEHVEITLYNSDGSMSEISGNGTRCVAALMVDMGIALDEVRVHTGAGLKVLRLTEAGQRPYVFEMGMGSPAYNGNVRQVLTVGAGTFDVTILNVGNPQCAVFVDSLEFNWQAAGAAIERLSVFQNRTNVSFVRVVDRHTVDVRFWERGAGETMSSGTGSSGAAFASIERGLVETPVRVLTPAGVLSFRMQGNDGFLTGPAELVAAGEYYLRR